MDLMGPTQISQEQADLMLYDRIEKLQDLQFIALSGRKIFQSMVVDNQKGRKKCDIDCLLGLHRSNTIFFT